MAVNGQQTVTAAASENVIPARASVNDQRSPIERFLEVPADPNIASVWSWDMMQRGVYECMTAAGWSYDPISYAHSQDGVDPNYGTVFSLPANQRAHYSRTRWGPDGAGGCEKQGVDLSHPINGLLSEYNEMITAIDGSPQLTAAKAAMFKCVESLDRHKAGTRSAIEGCRDESGYTSALGPLIDEYETAFVLAHRSKLELLKANRP